MKLYAFLTGTHAEIILYIIIMLANIDYVGILDYSIKAFVGSLIWFCFRVAGDKITAKYKNETKEEEK